MPSDTVNENVAPVIPKMLLSPIGAASSKAMSIRVLAAGFPKTRDLIAPLIGVLMALLIAMVSIVQVSEKDSSFVPEVSKAAPPERLSPNIVPVKEPSALSQRPAISKKNEPVNAGQPLQRSSPPMVPLPMIVPLLRKSAGLLMSMLRPSVSVPCGPSAFWRPIPKNVTSITESVIAAPPARSAIKWTEPLMADPVKLVKAEGNSKSQVQSIPPS